MLPRASANTQRISTNSPLQGPVLQNSPNVSNIVDTCRSSLAPLQPFEKLNALSQMFSAIVESNFHVRNIPVDFLRLAAEGMQNLHTAGRSNTIYLLTKALGTKRADESDTLLPLKRMPMGLIEYTAAFFTASSVQKV